MASKRRHWKEKDGRFWARVAVPKALQTILGKSELIEALGGDRRIADRNHAASVARLQERIAQARHSLEPATTPTFAVASRQMIVAADYDNAAWSHYTRTSQQNEMKRADMPTSASVRAEDERVQKLIAAGEIDSSSPFGMINAYTDYELMLGDRGHDVNIRTRRLAALRSALAAGETSLVDDSVRQYVDTNRLIAEPGTAEWQNLAIYMVRGEIEALSRSLEHDRGDYSGRPTDPVVKAPPSAADHVTPVPMKKLFHDYIASRQAIGKHRDGGANWDHAINALIKFLGHGDARRITKRNLLDWRDALMTSGKAAKTVSDKYLAAVRAVLRWAFENDRLETNPAESVQQEVPRKVQLREKGYTTPEAVKILKASISYKPVFASNPSNRESAHITAAKSWVPILCAFTGARITEMTQLRKEDIRQEGGRWILRVAPDAGSVKTSQYRDVPLHPQAIALGFTNFVKSANVGPLFHGATTPDKYLANARVTGGRLTVWLHSLNLVPPGVAPNYGWRHRLETQCHELGVSGRVLDAIQGHPGKTASDTYGDVTLIAKLRVLDALPDYDLADYGCDA